MPLALEEEKGKDIFEIQVKKGSRTKHVMNAKSTSGWPLAFLATAAISRKGSCGFYSRGPSKPDCWERKGNIIDSFAQNNIQHLLPGKGPVSPKPRWSALPTLLTDAGQGWARL